MSEPNASTVSETLRIAAFTAFREEISRRSNAQLQLITISLVGFSALASVVLGTEHSTVPYELLLLIPMLSSATGLLWLDHDRRIREIGDYILDEVFAGARGSFEERADQLEGKWTTRVLGFLAPTIAVFAGPSVTALVWAANQEVLNKAPLLWWIDLVLMLLYAWYFFWVMRTNTKARQRHAT